MSYRKYLRFAKPLRLYLYNAFFTKIPFSIIRLFLANRYLVLGAQSNICCNVKILNNNLKKDQIKIGENCVVNPDFLLDCRARRIIIHDNMDISMLSWIFTLAHDPKSDYHDPRQGD